jgi:type III secretion protein Q
VIAIQSQSNRPGSQACMSLVESARFPRVDELNSHLIKSIVRSATRVFDISGCMWSFCWRPDIRPHATHLVRMQAGNASLLVGVPNAIVRSSAQDAFDMRIPPGLRTALFAQQAASVLMMLERVLGHAVQISNIATFAKVSLSGAFAFQVSSPEAGSFIGFIKPENRAAVLALLRACLKEVPRDRRLNDVSINVGLIVGQSSLSISELVSLELEDTILLDTVQHREQGFTVRIRVGSGSVVGLADCMGSSAYVVETWFDEVKIMDEQAQSFLNASLLEAGNAEESQALSIEPGLLRVRISLKFEIASRQMSLAQLCALRPGEVIKLDMPVEQSKVTIYCGNDAIGSGQLVAVGEKLGVKVLSLPKPTTAHWTSDLAARQDQTVSAESDSHQ